MISQSPLNFSEIIRSLELDLPVKLNLTIMEMVTTTGGLLVCSYFIIGMVMSDKPLFSKQALCINRTLFRLVFYTGKKIAESCMSQKSILRGDCHPWTNFSSKLISFVCAKKPANSYFCWMDGGESSSSS